MTTEYKANCPYCNFFLIDDTKPEKIMQMIINHAKFVHKKVLVFESFSKNF